MTVFSLFCLKNKQYNTKKPVFVYQEPLGKRASAFETGMLGRMGLSDGRIGPTEGRVGPSVGLMELSEGRVGPRGETPGTQNSGAMSLRMAPMSLYEVFSLRMVSGVTWRDLAWVARKSASIPGMQAVLYM